VGFEPLLAFLGRSAEFTVLREEARDQSVVDGRGLCVEGWVGDGGWCGLAPYLLLEGGCRRRSTRLAVRAEDLLRVLCLPFSKRVIVSKRLLMVAELCS
jgi:hypothetical protein